MHTYGKFARRQIFRMLKIRGFSSSLLAGKGHNVDTTNFYKVEFINRKHINYNTAKGVTLMTKTDENLNAAFSGESKARNKYTYFAKVARTQGYHYVAKIFEETADNEMQHAKEEFKLLKGIGSTEQNLQEAVDGEHYETKTMYPEFEAQAIKDGNKAAAILFKEIGEVEDKHEKRYKKLLQMLKDDTLYVRSKPINWKCSKCGYIHNGTEPPNKCPCCHHEKQYFEPECMCFKDDCDCCCTPSANQKKTNASNKLKIKNTNKQEGK